MAISSPPAPARPGSGRPGAGGDALEPLAPGDKPAKGAKGGKGGKGVKTKGAKGEKAKGGLKKKLMKPILLVVVLALVAHVVMGKVVKPHYGPGNEPKAGDITGLGGVTTNLADGHLAQIDVSLQMTEAENTKEFAKDEAALVGETVQIVGEKTYEELLPAAGRAQLQSQLLAAYQKELGLSEGGVQVTAVYFTSFVLQ